MHWQATTCNAWLTLKLKLNLRLQVQNSIVPVQLEHYASSACNLDLPILLSNMLLFPSTEFYSALNCLFTVTQCCALHTTNNSSSVNCWDQELILIKGHMYVLDLEWIGGVCLFPSMVLWPIKIWGFVSDHDQELLFDCHRAWGDCHCTLRLLTVRTVFNASSYNDCILCGCSNHACKVICAQMKCCSSLLSLWLASWSWWWIGTDQKRRETSEQ
jgi:hypothetical protein